MDEIRLRIRAFITNSFLFGRTDETLSDHESLIENGVIDSTGVLQLVSFLEEEFGVRVEDDEIVPDNLDSLNRLSAFTSRKQKHFDDGAREVWDTRAALCLTGSPVAEVK